MCTSRIVHGSRRRVRSGPARRTGNQDGDPGLSGGDHVRHGPWLAAVQHAYPPLQGALRGAKRGTWSRALRTNCLALESCGCHATPPWPLADRRRGAVSGCGGSNGSARCHTASGPGRSRRRTRTSAVAATCRAEVAPGGSVARQPDWRSRRPARGACPAAVEICGFPNATARPPRAISSPLGLWAMTQLSVS